MKRDDEASQCVGIGFECVCAVTGIRASGRFQMTRISGIQSIVTAFFLVISFISIVSHAQGATYRREYHFEKNWCKCFSHLHSLLSVHVFSGTSISCYICSSRNGTDMNCHDPIHPESVSYVEHCKVPKENHNGLFPAYYCVKMIGISQSTNEEVVVRYCSAENMDNQCGDFKYQNEPFRGCILTCNYDGCNHTIKRTSIILYTLSSILVSTLFLLSVS